MELNSKEIDLLLKAVRVQSQEYEYALKECKSGKDSIPYRDFKYHYEGYVELEKKLEAERS